MPLLSQARRRSGRVHDQADRSGEARHLRRDVVRPAGQPGRAGARGAKRSGPPPAFRQGMEVYHQRFGAGRDHRNPAGRQGHEHQRPFQDGTDADVPGQPRRGQARDRNNCPRTRGASCSIPLLSRILERLDERIAERVDGRFAARQSVCTCVPGLWLDPVGPHRCTRVVVPESFLPRPAAGDPRHSPAGTRRRRRRARETGASMPSPTTSSYGPERRGITMATASFASGRARAGWRETGTFLKAITLLPFIRSLGCNTVHLLPITAIGRDGHKGNLGSPFAIRDPYALDEGLSEPALGLGAEVGVRRLCRGRASPGPAGRRRIRLPNRGERLGLGKRASRVVLLDSG